MAELGFLVPAEQTVDFIFHGAIALTDARFQTMAIHNADAATAVMDQSGVLQASCGYGHALAASTEHMSDELLGHQQVRAVFPVVTQQQPAAEPLFNRMQAIAHRGL